MDISAVAKLAHQAGARVIVDNVFASPILQSPLALGADIVVYSTTKHIDGQGRTLGGAILGSKSFIYEELQPLMRHTGPSMSPFNAWVVTKSLETLRLRVEFQTAAALMLAQQLGETSTVEQVLYPWLPTHPQHALAQSQMSGGGTIVTFDIAGGTAEAFSAMNRLRLIDISNNLGDTKTLITHPATTTHRRLGPKGRLAAGIGDNTLRISVGLEDIGDLTDDLQSALGS